MTAVAPDSQIGLGTGYGQIGIITEAATAIDVSQVESAPEASKDKLEQSAPASRDDSVEGTSVKPKEPETVLKDSSCSEAGCSTQAEELKPAAHPLKTAWRWFRNIPSYIWVALAVLVVFAVLAVTGAIFYTRSVTSDTRRATADAARSCARSIETLLDHLIAPMMSVAHLVQLQPHWPTVNASFPAFAEAIYKTNPFYQVEMCPYGLVGAMSMPWINATGNLTAEENWKIMLSFDYGVDILRPESKTHQDEINAIIQNGSAILLGPWYADGELSQGAFVVRYSIFLPPGDWDMPTPNSIEYCPYDVCNTPDGLTWWGWSNAVFAWKTVLPGLLLLDDRGLLYTLSPDLRAANQSFLAMSEPLPDPDECEIVIVDVYGWMSWTFCVMPSGGFSPTWRVGLLVGVTALALVLAGLVLLVLRSRHQAVEYLDKQLELNAQLAVAKEDAEEGRRVIEAEKRVMDALMQRQRNLIELFGKEDELLAEGDEALQRRLQLTGSGSQTSMSREISAVDRIEAVRRQLTGSRSTKSAGGANEIKLMEMLGEGSFGKVYRGLWRGTDVAVKTMVLPSNMSGAEKREKMAIMEAAISSSLAHPNIVQTYTYFIKTVREEAVSSDDGSQAAEGILVGTAGNTTAGSSVNKSFDEPSARNSTVASAQAVHGYEVRLVLEFCDCGCLRDALDGDAFLTATGVNYAGVLDTAADIAKAMLHLHLADVLHGDLKSRNVMLKSSGTEGRGVIGKVADFGLAVKMDHMDQTHLSGMYQGTLTHMAPELLLQGRMSKAADVYAFGITLWELFTGGEAFQGVPRALLGHQIAQERKRPAFPPFVPEAYSRLADECWSHKPEDRPTFESILERLANMRGTIPGPAVPLAAYTPGSVAGPHSVLAKLNNSQGDMVANANPVYDPNGSSMGSQLLGSSAGWEGGGGSGGSSINWLFARASQRTPLPVVEEDDREMDLSSKKLPVLRPPHLPAAQLPVLREGDSGLYQDAQVALGARASAELPEEGDRHVTI